MAANLELLDATFKDKAQQLILNCAAQGVIMRPFFTLRDVYEQASLYRQSRSKEEIMTKIAELRTKGAKYLAYCLETVGPSNGKWATNAIPGYSWHNWGLAIDCFVVGKNGEAIWSSSDKGYKVYAKEAKKLGLNAGYFWRQQDSVHVQSEALEVYKAKTLVEVDYLMKKKFWKENAV